MNPLASIILTAAVFLGAICVNGCAVVNVREEPRRVEPSGPPPSAAGDPRSISQLRSENAELRKHHDRLMNAHDRWGRGIAQRKSEIKALKNEREQAEDERDYWKKRLEKED